MIKHKYHDYHASASCMVCMDKIRHKRKKERQKEQKVHSVNVITTYCYMQYIQTLAAQRVYISPYSDEYSRHLFSSFNVISILGVVSGYKCVIVSRISFQISGYRQRQPPCAIHLSSQCQASTSFPFSLTEFPLMWIFLVAANFLDG